MSLQMVLEIEEQKENNRMNMKFLVTSRSHFPICLNVVYRIHPLTVAAHSAMTM